MPVKKHSTEKNPAEKVFFAVRCLCAMKVAGGEKDGLPNFSTELHQITINNADKLVNAEIELVRAREPADRVD